MTGGSARKTRRGPTPGAVAPLRTEFSAVANSGLGKLGAKGNFSECMAELDALAMRVYPRAEYLAALGALGGRSDCE